MSLHTYAFVTVRNRTPEELASAVTIASGEIAIVRRDGEEKYGATQYVLSSLFYLEDLLEYDEEHNTLRIKLSMSRPYEVMRNTERVDRIIRAAAYLGDCSILWSSEIDQKEKTVLFPKAPEGRPVPPDMSALVDMAKKSGKWALVNKCIRTNVEEQKARRFTFRGRLDDFRFIEDYMLGLYRGALPDEYWGLFGIRSAIELFCLTFGIRNIEDIAKVGEESFRKYASRENVCEAIDAAMNGEPYVPKSMVRTGLSEFLRSVGRNDLTDLCKEADELPFC